MRAESSLAPGDSMIHPGCRIWDHNIARWCRTLKTSFKIILLLVVVVSAFLAGSWITHRGSKHTQTAERKILYYVDPMNPAFKSEKPGIAPCGMALEPVYSGSDGQPLPANLPPGTIRINPEKQQLIGIKVAVVEKVPWNHTLRVLGRVTPDETRVYRINAAVAGMIKSALPVTTGSLVKENELLATFYSSQEYRSLVQSYFNAMKLSKSSSWKTEPDNASSQFSKAQLVQMRKAARELGQAGDATQIDYFRRNILNSGISAYQLAEMERTGAIPEEIEIRSPAHGFVVLRNVTPDLRFDKGAELFRIADISRVWVLADVFENEASFFQPGRRVKMELPYQKKTLYSRMSHVLPQFDPASRTLKIRLEANNPGYALRPDMFVNVEIPVSGPAAIIVHADAVIDSGLKKTVFIDRGNGYFEPRQVETGRSIGERVEITRGLMPGEKIVVSGNFLMDSESRMQQTVSGINGKAGRDSVCGMNVDEDRAKAAGFTKEYQGKTYFFCSNECRDEFIKMPGRYTETDLVKGVVPSSGLKTNAGADHSAHSSKKSEDRHPIHAAPHDHAGMKNPATGVPPAAAVDNAPMPMEERHVEKTKGMNNTVPAHRPQALTGPGDPVSPVMQVSPSMSMPSPQSAPSGPLGVPVQKATGVPGNGDLMSQPLGTPTMKEPNGEDSGRATRLRERRIIRRQIPGGITPGAPGDSSLPMSEKNRVISPGGNSSATEPHMKTTDDGQNHD